MTLQVQIPEPTKKRLIQLYNLLSNYKEEKITSLDIQRLTGWKDTLIRHDFWLLGLGKGVSNGYSVHQLASEIGTKLKLTEETSDIKNFCIVGLGRIGAALLDDNLFDQSQFKIKAGFDTNLYRVEILRSTFPLYPASEMDFVIKKENIQYAILTVDSKSAQKMTEKLVKAGIKGIVNMTSSVVTVPQEFKQNVKIENLSVVNALQMVI